MSRLLAVNVRVVSRRAQHLADRRPLFFARFTLEPGCHIYGAPLPERYTATSIEFGGPAVAHRDVTWPEPEMVEFAVLKEILPVYSGWFEIQGTLLFKFPLPEGELILSGYLRFHACSQTVCEPPQTVTCALPLTLKPF